MKNPKLLRSVAWLSLVLFCLSSFSPGFGADQKRGQAPQRPAQPRNAYQVPKSRLPMVKPSAPLSSKYVNPATPPGPTYKLTPVRPKGPAKIHKGSYAYTGPTHLYVIHGPNGYYKIGMSAGPLRKKDSQSLRAEKQVRSFMKKKGGFYRSQILVFAQGTKYTRTVLEHPLIKKTKLRHELEGNKGEW